MCEAELGTKATGERENQPVPVEFPFYCSGQLIVRKERIVAISMERNKAMI